MYSREENELKALDGEVNIECQARECFRFLGMCNFGARFDATGIIFCSFSQSSNFTSIACSTRNSSSFFLPNGPEFPSDCRTKAMFYGVRRAFCQENSKKKKNDLHIKTSLELFDDRKDMNGMFAH